MEGFRFLQGVEAWKVVQWYKWGAYCRFRGVLGLLPFFFLYKRPKNTP